MHQKTIHLIAAARPNFMKIAPLYHALKRRLGRTGYRSHRPALRRQHVGCLLPGSDAARAAPSPRGRQRHPRRADRQVMIAYEKLLGEVARLVVVVGDVNSTVACTLAAVKLTVTRPGGPPRGRPALLRPHHARGDQPHRHRRDRRPPLDAVARRR